MCYKSTPIYRIQKKDGKSKSSFLQTRFKEKRIKCQEEVTVNVEIEKIIESGQLKQVKGKLLPIKAEKSISADSLL